MTPQLGMTNITEMKATAANSFNKLHNSTTCC